jgi:hypothetical protein
MYGRGKLYGRAISSCKGFTQSLHKFTCAVKEGNVQRPACVPLVDTSGTAGGVYSTLLVVAVVARLGTVPAYILTFSEHNNIKITVIIYII